MWVECGERRKRKEKQRLHPQVRCAKAQFWTRFEGCGSGS